MILLSLKSEPVFYGGASKMRHWDTYNGTLEHRVFNPLTFKAVENFTYQKEALIFLQILFISMCRLNTECL